MAKTKEIPAKLSERLRYNPKTGKFSWKVHTMAYGGFRAPGDEAGTVKSDSGYVFIGLDGKIYRAHRLAWYIMTGEWLKPDQDIDHINRNRADNRWSNLRKATRSENNHNTDVLRTDNRSGHRGVSWRADTKKWHARIKVNGTMHLLGDYIRKGDAIAARRNAEISLVK